MNRYRVRKGDITMISANKIATLEANNQLEQLLLNEGYSQVDDYQFVKKVSDNVFIIYDKYWYGDENEYSDLFYDEVDLAEYLVEDKPTEELIEFIRSYYDDLEEIKKIYPDDWQQIVAEIIAECSH